MENILEVKNLCKSYDGFKLRNVSFEIPKGTIMGLIGENGAGKTTTIKAILNLIKINDGSIKVFGLDSKANESEIKEDIGVVLDNGFLSENLTPNDIDFCLKSIYKNWDSDLFFKYLEDFKLSRDKASKYYSSGMKMKLKLATALAHHPKLLILDEPTSGLDPIARSEILDVFQDFIQNEEHSVFVSSHITSDLENIADYITFINNGEIVLSKTRDEFLDKMGIARCESEMFEKVDKNDYIRFKKNKYVYDVLVEDKEEFKKKYEIDVIDRPRIEDIMIMYVKGEK